MLEILKEVVSTYLIPAVITIAGGFITWAAAKAKTLFEDKIKDEQTRKIVDDVVAYVERTLKNAENQEKFNTALDQASEWLISKGIEISTAELMLLIEASVNKLPKTAKE